MKKRSTFRRKTNNKMVNAAYKARMKIHEDQLRAKALGRELMPSGQLVKL